ncbi:hypothetical protein PM082_011945 [Marasmius tenuissimus]|nr:hypothetical protein PM082_011945 [Marasmius tenuissimus]
MCSFSKLISHPLSTCESPQLVVAKTVENQLLYSGSSSITLADSLNTTEDQPGVNIKSLIHVLEEYAFPTSTHPGLYINQSFLRIASKEVLAPNHRTPLYEIL